MEYDLEDASPEPQAGSAETEDVLDPYEDYAEISKRINDTLATDKFVRSLFERDWFRNVLFDRGAQWIIYANGRWRQKDLPSWFPRSQTNKFAEKKRDLVGQFVNGQPIPVTYVPANEDPESEATAAVSDRLREVIYAEAKIDEQKEKIASWLVDTGNCFAIPYYDMDEKHGTVFVQHQSCPDCGDNQITAEMLAANPEGDAPYCPNCGPGGSPLEPSVDPKGNELGEKMPIGALCLDVYSPFEIRGDYRIPDVRDWKRFVCVRRMDVDKAKEEWPEFKDQILPDTTGDDTGTFYLDVIAHITSNYNTGMGLTGDSGTSKTPRVTIFKFYELPSEKYPEGIQAVRIGKAGDIFASTGPLDTEYGAGVREDQKFLPLLHAGFSYVPGQLYRKTPLDDVVPLQLLRNTVEANIRLSVQRMGNGVWLNPKGSGVDILTGEPGQVIPYNPVSMGGTTFAKPERLPAELNNLAPLIMLIRSIDDWIERIAGTFFLQGGQAPPGVTAASALAYLGEKGQQSFSAPMVAWVNFWVEFEKQALEICRKNWTDARIRRILGKNKKWQTEKFSSADIQGAVDMIIDHKAAFQKSTAEEQARIAMLVQLGMVDPGDPEMRIEVLTRFGELSLKGSIDRDKTYAAKIQDRFLNGELEVPTVRPLIDNSQVLLGEAINFAKTDEYDELPPDRQQIWLEYCKNLAADIAARRVALTATGLDPDVPALAEVPSALAAVGALAGAQDQQAAAAAQSGGIPSGGMSPDPRLDAKGNPLPPPSPDIADDTAMSQTFNGPPQSIHPEGSPRRIDLPA